MEDHPLVFVCKRIEQTGQTATAGGGPLCSSVCFGGEVFDDPATVCMSEFRRTEGPKQKAMEMNLSKLPFHPTVIGSMKKTYNKHYAENCDHRPFFQLLWSQLVLTRLAACGRMLMDGCRHWMLEWHIDVPIRLQSSLQCQVVCVVFWRPLQNRQCRLTPEPKLSNRVSDVALVTANSYKGRTILFDFRSPAQNSLLAQHLAKR
ncbi:Cyclin-B1-5 [Trichinella pseudospiralis]